MSFLMDMFEAELAVKGGAERVQKSRDAMLPKRAEAIPQSNFGAGIAGNHISGFSRSFKSTCEMAIPNGDRDDVEENWL